MQRRVALGVDRGGRVGVGFFEERDEFEGCAFRDSLVEGLGRSCHGGGVRKGGGRALAFLLHRRRGGWCECVWRDGSR